MGMTSRAGYSVCSSWNVDSSASMHRLPTLAAPSLARQLSRALRGSIRMAGTECCATPPVDYPAQHQAIIPAPEANSVDVVSWLDGQASGASGQEHRRMIFCNRTLDMSSMEAIGFDMVCTSVFQLVHCCAHACIAVQDATSTSCC